MNTRSLVSLLILGILTVCAERVYSQATEELSVKDIIVGIESRDSNLNRYLVEYEISTKFGEAFYRSRKYQDLISEGKPPAAASLEARNYDVNKALAGEPRRLLTRYTLIVSDGKAASTVYDSELLLEGKRKPQYLHTFDGHVHWTLNTSGSGGIGTGKIDDCIPQQTPESFLCPSGQKAIIEHLRGEGVEVVATRFLNADLLIDVRCRRLTQAQDLFGYYNITFNMTKNAWPTSISEVIVVGDDKRELTVSKLEIESFHHTGSLYYPKVITRRMIDNAQWSAAEASEFHSCTVERFELNPTVRDDFFTLKFPPSTLFRDADTGKGYWVSENGSTIAKDDTLQKVYNQLQTWGMMRVLLLVMSIILICLMTALYCNVLYRRQKLN